MYYCFIVLLYGIFVVYWPSTMPNMPFQSDALEWSGTFRWLLWEEMAWARLADNMGQCKIPRYTHKLMHPKKVTCELHDSYFRLMTIKHAIPRTAEMTHPGGKSWGDIEWAIELLYNSVKSVSFGVLETRWWQDAVERKTSTQRKEPPGLRLSNPGERERLNADGYKSGGQYVAVLFGLQLPLTHKPFKKRERYIF